MTNLRHGARPRKRRLVVLRWGAMDTSNTSAPVDWWTVVAWAAAGTGAALGAIHGYHRNGDSAGWGLVWGILGFAAPVVTVPVALLQGFAEPSDSERIKRIEAGLRPDIAARLEAST